MQYIENRFLYSLKRNAHPDEKFSDCFFGHVGKILLKFYGFYKKNPPTGIICPQSSLIRAMLNYQNSSWDFLRQYLCQPMYWESRKKWGRL